MSKQGAPLSWISVVAGAYLLGVALSGAVSAFGVTVFPDDRRGEWSTVVLPVLLFGSAALTAIGYRQLTRSGHNGTWKVRSVIAFATSCADYVRSRLNVRFWPIADIVRVAARPKADIAPERATLH